MSLGKFVISVTEDGRGIEFSPLLMLGIALIIFYPPYMLYMFATFYAACSNPVVYKYLEPWMSHAVQCIHSGISTFGGVVEQFSQKLEEHALHKGKNDNVHVTLSPPSDFAEHDDLFMDDLSTSDRGIFEDVNDADDESEEGKGEEKGENIESVVENIAENVQNVENKSSLQQDDGKNKDVEN
jgi:hypothetical protein